MKYRKPNPLALGASLLVTVCTVLWSHTYVWSSETNAKAGEFSSLAWLEPLRRVCQQKKLNIPERNRIQSLQLTVLSSLGEVDTKQELTTQFFSSSTEAESLSGTSVNKDTAVGIVKLFRQLGDSPDKGRWVTMFDYQCELWVKRAQKDLQAIFSAASASSVRKTCLKEAQVKLVMGAQNLERTVCLLDNAVNGRFPSSQSSQTGLLKQRRAIIDLYEKTEFLLVGGGVGGMHDGE